MIPILLYEIGLTRVYILPYLDISDIRTIICSCRDMKINMVETYQDLIQERIQYIENNYHPTVIDLMGGYHNMMKFPILPWLDQYVGDTGYIDGILPNDMLSSIMIGKQNDNERSFIVMKTCDHRDHIYLDILFQRFPSKSDDWVLATSGRSILQNESGYCIRDGVVIHDLLAFNICNIIENRGFIMKYTHMIGSDIKNIKDIYLS